MHAGNESSDEDPEPQYRFRILVVCTANICRSPMAEVLFQLAADEAGLPWVVSSAGTMAEDGSHIYPLAAEALVQHAGATAPDHWGSRRLTAELIRDSDLVLTAELAHRKAVVELLPAAVQRTFLLLDFARLAERITVPEDLPPASESGRAMIRAALQARSQVRAVDESLELMDPIGHALRVFRKGAELIDAAADKIVRAALALGAGAPEPVAAQPEPVPPQPEVPVLKSGPASASASEQSESGPVSERVVPQPELPPSAGHTTV